MSGQAPRAPKGSVDAYGLVREAIEKRQQVIATYHGYHREMCPHALGFNKRGERQALFYQFAGQSSRELGPSGSPDNWRCMQVDELIEVSIRDGGWHTAPDHTRPQTCVFHRLDLAIKG